MIKTNMMKYKYIFMKRKEKKKFVRKILCTTFVGL